MWYVVQDVVCTNVAKETCKVWEINYLSVTEYDGTLNQ